MAVKGFPFSHSSPHDWDKHQNQAPVYSEYDKMNNENHLSAVGNQRASDKINARPDDTIENNQNSSSVDFSLAGIEEDVNFAEAVNGE